jgi:hypothetical protein
VEFRAVGSLVAAFQVGVDLPVEAFRVVDFPVGPAEILVEATEEVAIAVEALAIRAKCSPAQMRTPTA